MTVAGTVGNAFREVPEGVQFLGFVANLDREYARAAVVISPLTVGSGLKIKLIEAMAAGKAIVATPVTLQGLEGRADDALICTDTPALFGQAILDLLGAPARRMSLGLKALTLARDYFNEDSATAQLAEAIQRLARGGPTTCAKADF